MEWFLDDDKRQCLRVTNLNRYYIGLPVGDLHYGKAFQYFDNLMTEKRNAARANKETEGVQKEQTTQEAQDDRFVHLMDVFTFQDQHKSEMRPEEVITLRLSSGSRCFEVIDHWRSPWMLAQYSQYENSQKRIQNHWIKSNPYFAVLSKAYPNQEHHECYGNFGHDYSMYYKYHLPAGRKYDSVLISMYSHHTREKFQSELDTFFRPSQNGEETSALLTQQMEECLDRYFHAEPSHVLLSRFDDTGHRVYERVDVATPEELVTALDRP